MSFDQIIDALTKTGVIGLLAVILYGGVKGVWIWGWAHDEALAAKDQEISELRREKEELWDLLKQAVGIVDDSTAAAARATKIAHVTLPAATLGVHRRPRGTVPK